MKKLLLLMVLVFGLHAESVAKLKKSCDLNNGQECANLGMLYADGEGVKQNYTKARKYFKKACDLNNGMGCSYHGIIYLRALGVKMNTSLGTKYVQRGCDLNDGEGCFQLGAFIYQGKDNKKAKKYLKKACKLKHALGCFSYEIYK